MVTFSVAAHNQTYSLPVIFCGCQTCDGVGGDYKGCVFKVGEDMYFVPTQHVANQDTLYIACDTQRIEGGPDAGISLGEGAKREIEHAILNHLFRKQSAKKDGEAFVVTSSGKTFRL
jgi:hypothetical protein